MTDQPIILKSTRRRRVMITSRDLKQLEGAKRRMLKVQQKILYDNPNAASVVLPTSQECKSCKTLVDEYFSTLTNLSPSYLADKKRHLKVFVDWLGPQPLTRDAVERFNVELHSIEGWGNGMKWAVGRAVASFLTFLFESRRIADDIRRGIKFPKQPVQVARENYSKEDIEKLLEAAGDRPIGFIIRLAYHTGFALVDACELLWENIDMERGVIRRPRRKTKVESVVTFDFGSPMRAALEAQMRDTIAAFGSVQPRLPVCRHFYSPMNSNGKVSAAIMFKRLCANAGVKYRSFHSLRATMISELAHSDAPLAVSMSVCGLRDPAQFLAYVTPQPEKIREQIRRMRT